MNQDHLRRRLKTLELRVNLICLGIRFLYLELPVQFPHSGSREAINGTNSNYLLVHDFLSSAIQLLKKDEIILITVVDSDYYNNIFKFEELAELVGFKGLTQYIFDPKVSYL